MEFRGITVHNGKTVAVFVKKSLGGKKVRTLTSTDLPPLILEAQKQGLKRLASQLMLAQDQFKELAWKNKAQMTQKKPWWKFW